VVVFQSFVFGQELQLFLESDYALRKVNHPVEVFRQVALSAEVIEEAKGIRLNIYGSLGLAQVLNNACVDLAQFNYT